MRLREIGSLIVVAAFGMMARSAFAADPVEITLPVSKIYVPDGFDDNDSVEIAMKGVFKSSCYKVGHTSAKVNHEAREIEITASAYEYDGVCADVLVPFLEVVKVGKLVQGAYAISVKNVSGVSGAVDVARRTTEAPDDFLYAPVDQASVQQAATTRRQSVNIKGTYPYCFHGCMKIREVRVMKTPEGVLTVLPISDLIEGSECEERQGNQSFDITTPMTEPFQGEGLLHVRVLNGASLNKLIELY